MPVGGDADNRQQLVFALLGPPQAAATVALAVEPSTVSCAENLASSQPPID